jgi:hypothetical protein
MLVPVVLALQIQLLERLSLMVVVVVVVMIKQTALFIQAMVVQAVQVVVVQVEVIKPRHQLQAL